MADPSLLLQGPVTCGVIRGMLASQRISGDAVLVHDSLGMALLRNALLTEHTAPQAPSVSRMIPNQPAGSWRHADELPPPPERSR